MIDIFSLFKNNDYIINQKINLEDETYFKDYDFINNLNNLNHIAVINLRRYKEKKKEIKKLKKEIKINKLKKEIKKYENKIKEYENRFNKPILECLAGNLFYTRTDVSNGFILNRGFKSKRENIYNLCKTSKRVLEVGFNAGHSALLILHSNPNVELYCFDICMHPYTKPCFNYLKNIFKDRIKLIEGDSFKTLKTFFDNETINFDLFHHDGCHSIESISHDITIFNNFSILNNIIIIDDTNDKIREYINSFCKENNWKDITKNYNFTFDHMIIKKDNS